MMRNAQGATTEVNEQGEIFAISLGADYVAEHEWGINNLYRSFGIARSDIGVNPKGIMSRVVNTVPDKLILEDFNKPVSKKDSLSHVGWIGTLLTLTSYPDDHDPEENRELYDFIGRAKDSRGRATDKDDLLPISSAWSGSDFAVFARKAEEIQFLKDLYQEFHNNNVAVWLGGGGVFQNAGLCFAIVDRLPMSLQTKFLEQDTITEKTNIADRATGIKDRLEAAGKRYFALSPKLKSGVKVTAHDVVYWLNPMDQDRNNYGTFTVEELDAWIEGKGPIPKQENVSDESIF